MQDVRHPIQSAPQAENSPILLCVTARARDAIPVPFRTTRRFALVKVSRVTGSLAKPSSSSAQRVNLMGMRSFSRSFFPLAGQ